MRIMGVVSWLNGPASLDEARLAARLSYFQMFVAVVIAALFQLMALVCAALFLGTVFGVGDDCFGHRRCDQSFLDQYPLVFLAAGLILFLASFVVAAFIAHTRWGLLLPLFTPATLAIGVITANYV